MAINMSAEIGWRLKYDGGAEPMLRDLEWPPTTKSAHYNAHYCIFAWGGFQNCSLFNHYFSYYFNHYSKFRAKITIMDEIIEQIIISIMSTLKDPNMLE